MSMLVRKGTMLHRKGSRRSSHPPGLRRASIASASPSTSARRPSTVSSATLSPGGPSSRRPSMGPDASPHRRANSLRPNIQYSNATRSPRASITPITATGIAPMLSTTITGTTPTGPGIAVPMETVSPRVSPRTSLTLSATSDEDPSRRYSATISVDDRRRLYVKATEEGRHCAAYGSIAYQLREANHESKGFWDYLWRSIKIVGTTVAATFFLGMYSILPLLMMIVGVQYRKECPKEPNIPTYLLIGGAFSLIELMVLFWRQLRSRRYERLHEGFSDGDLNDLGTSITTNVTEACLSIFLLVWFILGNYWVFHIYQPRYVPLLHEPSNWCDKTLYSFALVQLLITHGVIIFLFLLFTLLTCATKVLGAFDWKP